MSRLRKYRGRDSLRNSVFASIPQQNNIIFQHNIYDGALSPQIGSSTYTRTGAIVVATDSNTVSSFATDTMPIGVRRQGSETLKGVWLGGGVKNWILASEDFTDGVWTAIGGGAASANTTTAPDGTVTADTISGSSAGDGITQTTGVAAGSVCWVGSVWLKATSGAPQVRLQLQDEGIQANFVDVVLSSTWKRYQVPKVFFTATGNVSVSIIVGNTNTVRAWGAQVERFNFTNTTGSRDRRSIANQYVKTTNAVATATNSNIEIPNSIFSQVTATGSVAFWILCEYDWMDVNGLSPSISQYLFSANFDQFSMCTERDKGLVLRINDSEVACTSTGGFGNTLYGIDPNGWTHVAVTWNTTTDSYKIYINGNDVTGTTSTASDIVTSTYVLNLGTNHATNFPYVCLDGFMSQMLIWKTVISAAEVSQLYNTLSPIATRSAPSTDKIFSVALGTSIIPTVGDTEYHYNHRGDGSFYYANTTTSLKASDLTSYPIPAYPLNGANKGGFPFVSNQHNNILQSEAIETTWTAVGSPTITANVGTFLSSLTYGTIGGNSDEGIQQSVATAVASTGWVGSVYASVQSGTLACRLTLEGDSGGSPQSTSSDITLTTTPQRFDVYKLFTSGGTGNIRLKFVLRATGTARVSGFQLEQQYPDDSIGTLNKKPAPYVKTTTAGASYRHNQIIYRAADSFNVNKGTAIIWAYLNSNPGTDWISGQGPTLIAAPGQYGGFYYHTLPGLNRLMWSGIAPYVENSSFSVTQGQWSHYAVTWDNSVPEARIYLDGVLIATGNTASKTATQRKIMIGGDGYFGPMDYWAGAIDTIDIYGSAQSTATILADYNATKATYGR